MDVFAPVHQLADSVTFEWFGLVKQSYWGSAVNFFIYDFIKIGLLLVLINYVMAIVRYYMPMERIRAILARRRWYGLDYLLAALLGVVTPFCSCSSIPLFIGFVSAGIPLGITFAFLITSPLVNEASIALFPAMFGVKTTILYNLAGIAVGVSGGMLIQRLKLERYIEPSILAIKSSVRIEQRQSTKLSVLLKLWWKDGWQITKSLLPYVMIGVGIGALIHGFIPAQTFEHYLANKSWWTVPLATLLGIPLYANSVSVVPVIEALIGKGVPLGTALAFMTSTVTLSIPGALILKQAIRLPLLLTFFGITTVGIMLMGYLFNWIG